MRRTTHYKAAAVLSAAALLLTACGSDTKEPENTGGGDSPTTDTTPATGGGTDTDQNTATGDAPAASGEFKLGYVLPETGQLAFLGPPQVGGLTLALRDINEAGGVLGTEVPKPIPGDEAGQEPVAQASADRILGQGVSAIIGAAASGMSLAIIDRVTNAGVMQCSGSNTAPTFTDYADNGLYIRTAPSDALQGPVLANTIVNDGWSNVAIIARADDYGQGLADATAKSLENAGATVAVKETYDPLGSDYNSAIQSAVSANPDAVVVIAFEEGVQILQGLIENGLTPAKVGFYGADGMRSPDLAKLVNENNPKVLAGMKGTAPASADNEEFLASLAEFDPDLGDNTQYAPQVYDCVVVMALAAEAAKSVDAEDFKSEVVGVTREGEKCTSFGQCRDMLTDGTDIDYDGVSGPLDFTDVGEPGVAEIEVWGFNDEGKFESLETIRSEPEDQG